MRPFIVLTAFVVVAGVVAAKEKYPPLPQQAGGRSGETVNVCGTVYGATIDGTGQSRAAVLHVGGLTGALHLTTLTGGAAPYLFVVLRDGYWIAPNVVEEQFLLKGVCVTGKIETVNQRLRIVVRDATQVRLTGDSPKFEPPLMAGAHWPWEEGVEQPKLLRQVSPRVTSDAMRAHVNGVVVLLAVVGPDDQPHDIRVVQPLGLGLDEVAVESLKQWRFIPGTFQGKPAAVIASFEMAFVVR